MCNEFSNIWILDKIMVQVLPWFLFISVYWSSELRSAKMPQAEGIFLVFPAWAEAVGTRHLLFSVVNSDLFKSNLAVILIALFKNPRAVTQNWHCLLSFWCLCLLIHLYKCSLFSQIQIQGLLKSHNQLNIFKDLYLRPCFESINSLPF